MFMRSVVCSSIYMIRLAAILCMKRGGCSSQDDGNTVHLVIVMVFIYMVFVLDATSVNIHYLK
jgi:hypothetical protein